MHKNTSQHFQRGQVPPLAHAYGRPWQQWMVFHYRRRLTGYISKRNEHLYGSRQRMTIKCRRVCAREINKQNQRHCHTVLVTVISYHRGGSSLHDYNGSSSSHDYCRLSSPGVVWVAAVTVSTAWYRRRFTTLVSLPRSPDIRHIITNKSPINHLQISSAATVGTWGVRTPQKFRLVCLPPLNFCLSSNL